MSKNKYKITTTSAGDRIRHRVATIVLDGNGAALVDMNGWMWCPEFPGGGVDAHESTIDAAMRELMEEAGWTATDPYLYSSNKEYVYSINEPKWLDTHQWNKEENLAVICNAGDFLPTHAFGSEGDALQCKMTPIHTVLTALQKRMAGGMPVRHRVKNELLVNLLTELLEARSHIPKWTKW